MDDSKLAENKLILLYVLKKINFPISSTQLSKIILENDLLNYFALQENITFLLESDFIEKNSDKFMDKFKLTHNGMNMLSMFEQHINYYKRNLIDDYISENINDIKSDMSIKSNYIKANDGSYIANLNLTENECTLLDISINVPTQIHAKNICDRWRKNPNITYLEIFNLLVASTKD